MNETIIENQSFQGERSLFHKENLIIRNCLFHDGESPLKEGKRLTVDHSTFAYKYPLWYGKEHQINDCVFEEMARSGIWYTDHSSFSHCNFIAPKLFRRCNGITIRESIFSHAKETLWFCNDVRMENIKAEEGDYFGKDSSDIIIEQFHLNGNYCFDGGRNITVRNSILNSKDAFWNCGNVTLENCTVIGEYFGWNSKNITLKHCHIVSHQGFCYMENLTILDSTIENSDLIFEYCKNIDVHVDSYLDSVKNPSSGVIESLGIKDLILDENRDKREEVTFLTKEKKR